MENEFAKVMNYPEEMKVFDLSEGYNPVYIRSFGWGIGKYNEKRQNMYTAPQFGGKPTYAKAERNIHMGIDIWTTAGSPVYAFWDGIIAYFQGNDRRGDYGATVVTEHSGLPRKLQKQQSARVYALYGHLSKESLKGLETGRQIKKGEKIAEIGSEKENGGWAPHLHFQLSLQDPSEADMPGVVSQKEHEQALATYPDPRIVLGDIY